MIEKFIHNLQIQLGLDKDCVVFPDQRITSPKNRESFVFKTDKFIALTGSSGWRIGLDPVIAINIDNAKNTGLIDRITGFWSPKDQDQTLNKRESNNIKEPAFTEKAFSSEVKKQTEMDIIKDEIDSTVLEIPAFLRRQAN